MTQVVIASGCEAISLLIGTKIWSASLLRSSQRRLMPGFLNGYLQVEPAKSNSNSSPASMTTKSTFNPPPAKREFSSAAWPSSPGASTAFPVPKPAPSRANPPIFTTRFVKIWAQIRSTVSSSTTSKPATSFCPKASSAKPRPSKISLVTKPTSPAAMTTPSPNSNAPAKCIRPTSRNERNQCKKCQTAKRTQLGHPGVTAANLEPPEIAQSNPISGRGARFSERRRFSLATSSVRSPPFHYSISAKQTHSAR